MGNWLQTIMRENNRFNQTKGFSLLELLIALTILAIALVPVAYFYTKSLQMVEEASIRTRALNLAQERMAEIRQMPYDDIRTNVTPSVQQLNVFGDGPGGTGDIDTDTADWYGYDFEGYQQWRAMFFYPLPLDYNPYQPQTQGYNNAIGANHYIQANPIADYADPHVNFNVGGTIDYEYEPIGFYQQKVYLRNRTLAGWADRQDVRLADRRTLTLIEPSLDSGNDHYRSGVEQQVDNYSIYGRRTIILDVLPDPLDTDPDLGTADGYAPDDDRDGGGTAVNPYPLAKGPDNKFQVASRQGSRGKLVIVQVFWLPRDATEEYLAWEDLNKVELRSFVAAGNEYSNLPATSGEITRNDYLHISPPN